MATLRTSTAMKTLNRPASSRVLTVRAAGRSDSHDGQAKVIQRRTALGLAALIVPATLTLGQALAAPSPMELFDNRSAAGTLRSLDQARDDSAHYTKERFSLRTDALTLQDQKKRALESFERLKKDIKASVDSKTYYLISNDIRHQLGYFRYDLNSLTAALPPNVKKQAVAAKNKAFQALEALDLSARRREDAALPAKYSAAVAAVEAAVALI